MLISGPPIIFLINVKEEKILSVKRSGGSGGRSPPEILKDFCLRILMRFLLTCITSLRGAAVVLPAPGLLFF